MILSLRGVKDMPILLCTLAAIMWAGCGVAAQHLFSVSQIGVMELTALRMLVTAIIMGVIFYNSGHWSHNWNQIWKHPILVLHFIVYGLVGLLAMHVTYFKAIEYSNAAVATVIQYTCPAMILLWTAMRNRVFPSIFSVLAVLLAAVGTFLIATKGDFYSIRISIEGLIYAVLSAMFLAVATVYPKHLLAILDNSFLLSAGMAVGGMTAWIIVRPVNWANFGDMSLFCDLFVIVICGTAGAFICFNAGLKYLSPTRASLIATIEPAVSVIMSYIFFKLTFSLLEMTGIFFILLAIVLSGKDHSYDKL